MPPSIAAESTINHRVRRWVLVALLAGAVINLAAGARRPAIERAILASNYYPAAQSAANAIQQLPPNARLAVLGYATDIVEEVDMATWVDYRLKWLLYPRLFTAYRVKADGSLERRIAYQARNPSFAPATDLGDSEYALSFRISTPPTLPPGRWEVMAQDQGYLLARRMRQ